MHKYTKPAHRQPLSLQFHCMHRQSPTSPSNCPEYKLEYFPTSQSLMGGKLFSTQFRDICAYCVPLQHLIRTFSITNSFSEQTDHKRTRGAALLCPRAPQHRTAPNAAKEGEREDAPIPQSSESSGLHRVNAPFFPFLTLPVLEDPEPCIKCSKMQSYSFSVEALRVTNLPEHDAKHRALLGCKHPTPTHSGLWSLAQLCRNGCSASSASRMAQLVEIAARKEKDLQEGKTKKNYSDKT